MNRWFWVGCLLLAVTLLLWILLERKRSRSGIPKGRLVYDDIVPLSGEPQVLFSDTLRLSGKPDAIFEENGRLIPVEIKSGKAPAQPYHAHVIQLLAYCLLVESVYRRRPPYGLLKYRDKEFKISYTIEREKQVKGYLSEALADLDRKENHRSHADPRRCAVCGYRERCDEKIETK